MGSFYGDGYPDSAGDWLAGQDGAPAQWEYPYSQANGEAGRQPVDGWRVTGYPPPGPRRGYPPPPYNGHPPGYRPGTGPMRAYRPQSGPMAAYQPEDYRRRDSGPMGAYQPTGYRPDSGPQPRYRPGTGPMRAYRPDSGSPVPGRPSASTTLIAEYPPDSGPMPVYRPSDGIARLIEDLLPGGKPAPADRLPGGKTILEWLPFGNRIVLLPKDAGGAGEALREHRDTSEGWLRPAVFGAMDGLVTNSSLIAGIGAGGGGHAMIVLTGVAGLIAGAFSMATGEYISVKSQNELNLAEVELERKQHARDPRGKRARLAEIYMEKGVSPNLAEAVARQVSADQDRAVLTHAREDLGIDPDDLPSPRTAAIASLASFTVGALIPLAPFLAGFPSLSAALGLASVAAFTGGAAVARLTGRSMLLGGFRQFTAAFLGTGMSFLAGHLISGHVS